MINGGIFGPKLSGKTTLAKQLAPCYWHSEGRRGLVFDPFLDDWGQTCWVTNDSEVFWPTIWNQRECLVIVDEAAMTVARDREKIPIFTSMRHCGHKLLIIGHSGRNLLPDMREQLDTLYLFRQPPKAAEIWAEQMSCPEILSATELNQYEFLFCRTYAKPERKTLTVGQ